MSHHISLQLLATQATAATVEQEPPRVHTTISPGPPHIQTRHIMPYIHINTQNQSPIALNSTHTSPLPRPRPCPAPSPCNTHQYKIIRLRPPLAPAHPQHLQVLLPPPPEPHPPVRASLPARIPRLLAHALLLPPAPSCSLPLPPAPSRSLPLPPAPSSRTYTAALM